MTNGITASVPVANLVQKPRRIDSKVVVGKDVLELLTGAMYNDPLTVFREYVQNAADAIEDAVQNGLLASMSDGCVNILLDVATRSIVIRDNGVGLSAKEFIPRLTSVGASAKRGRHRRGFRGVGRLSGLGYCQEMVFRSKSADDARPQELVWNGRRLKELLRDSKFEGTLEDAIREVVSTRSIPLDEYPSSFFEVELRGVMRIRNDILLNEEVVRAYLSQVAPVPFAPGFSFANDIEAFLRTHGIDKTINIEINDGKGYVYRPHANSMRVSNAVVSAAQSVETLEVLGIDGDVVAAGWILHHDYVGAFSKASAVGGLRLRAGNIQVGTDALLDQIFSEARFNGWSIGEIHVLTPKIVPNGRRDDFEANSHWYDLLGKLRLTAQEQAKRCRSQSQGRLMARRGKLLFEQLSQSIQLAKTYSKLQVATEFLVVEIEDKFIELKKLRDKQVNPQARSIFDGWVAALEKPIAALKRTGDRNNALEFLPQNQRTTFKNALELILKLSPDPSQASKLVEQVISHARRAYA